MGKTCSVENCTRPKDRLGFCGLHYLRFRRHGDPTAGGTKKGAHKDFLEMVVSGDSEDCIIWPFSIGPSGYGQTKIDGKMFTAHRAALYLASGVNPPGKIHAAHDPVACSDRRCVNPKHLRWASAAENESDKILSATDSRGEKNGNAAFTDEQIRVIRGLETEHWKIAAAFSVSTRCIDSIMSGKTYRAL